MNMPSNLYTIMEENIEPQWCYCINELCNLFLNIFIKIENFIIYITLY